MDYKTYINSSQHRPRMMYYQYIVPNPFYQIRCYHLRPIFFTMFSWPQFSCLRFTLKWTYQLLPCASSLGWRQIFTLLSRSQFFVLVFVLVLMFFSTTKYQESVSFKNSFSPGKKGSKSRYRDASRQLRNTGLEQRCPTVLIRSPHLKHS